MVKLSIADQLIQLRHKIITPGTWMVVAAWCSRCSASFFRKCAAYPKHKVIQSQSRRSCLATTGSKIFVRPDWKLHFEYRFAVDRF